MKPIEKSQLKPEDRRYDYLLDLTAKLDAYDSAFDRSMINEIALWKVNRYPVVPDDVLTKLNRISKTDEAFDPESIRELLLLLLACHGVGLPMASTFLRFRNPKLFQIIDQRVYRVIYGREMKLPSKSSQPGGNKLVDVYLEYLRKLRETCIELDIPFEESDRILYMADKRINKNVKLPNY